MDPSRRVLEGYSIAIKDGIIVEISETKDLESKYLRADVLDASGRIVMPGLICSHSHLYGIMLRGATLRINPPSDFTQILQRVWWPVDEVLTSEDAFASALISSVEFAKSGVTMFADTYSGPNSINGILDRIAGAIEQVGIRGFIAFEATERHSKVEGSEGIRENIRFAEKMQAKTNSKVKPLFSIHASFTVSDSLIKEVRALASKYRVPVTIHTSEGMGDVEHNLENYGKRTLERLQDVGLLGPDVVLVHCVNVSDDEIDIIARTNTGVAHNPMSNMLNAVGVSPVLEMIKKHVNVGLGNDGYIFDMFENMRATFLVHRLQNRNPNAIDPYTILEMSTINGAKLYGMDKELGSLQVGKRADIVVIKPALLPTPLNANTVVGHLINTVDGDDVEHVLVDGKSIVMNKRLLTCDEEKAQSLSQEAAASLWSRLSIDKAQIDTLKK